MARAQDGEQAAYRLLLEELTPYLRAIARRRLGQQEVDDAVQDILLSLHGVRHTYDPARLFKPWLIAIARRRLVDRLRRNLRRAAVEAPLDDDVTIADERANSHENVLDMRSLRRAVAELPARQKEAVLLLRFQEMTGKEAAEATGRTEGALKVSLHRAVESLRRMLGAG
ncbi:MAG TPA: sigma-70 family RNA polymerase sigma factor [Geminicoccaceae bacterium]|nr:sigma-70 family RNA polymerase sigma factor [Geminicoccus sp.]HMU52506.1 sigma-70 family RNA polymerase sigma factor [Geminicoccaceae bacterium]